MKRTQIAIFVGILLLVSMGSAQASRFLNSNLFNSRFLNSRFLNSRFLNSADLNAVDGSSTFYNPYSGRALPNVYLDKTTFVSDEWVCDSETQSCWIERHTGDDFVGTWTNATLTDANGALTPTWAYIAGRWQPPGADPDTYLYWVYAWAEDTSHNWGWQPVCNDAQGYITPAIPVSGEWNHTNGARTSYGGNKFTWACTTGALGKCAASGEPNTLGYAPWKSSWYHRLDRQNQFVQVSGQRTHQTCTRMIRADYCGDGVPRTVDGTPIEVNNFFLGGDRTNTTNWFTEALWKENGAYWISCGRLTGYGQPISCPGRLIYNNGTDQSMCFDLREMPTPEDVDASPQRTTHYRLPVFDLVPGTVVLGTRSSNTNLYNPYW